MEPIGKQVFDILERPEWERLRRVRRLHFSRGLVTRNYKRVAAVAEKLTTLPHATELMSVTNRHLLHAHLTELAYSLHNFAASAKSLVEHTRRTVRFVFPSGYPEYESRVVERFKDSGELMFVQDLRNFILHRDLPNTRIEARLTPTTAEFSLPLETSDLLEWDRWSPKARGFIEAAGSSIDLGAVVHNYAAAVDESYDWLLRDLEEKLRPEIDELERARVAELSHAWPKLVSNLERDLASGRSNVEELLYPFLSMGELRKLQPHRGTPTTWLAEALGFVEAKGTIPSELKDRLRVILDAP